MSENNCTSTYKAIVEYDGTDYFGFQRQIAEQKTIQGEIERVIGRITRQNISILGAGRTDAGVHARGQVVSFVVEWRHSAEALQRALNANLPRDIAIRQLRIVSDDFHPRFAARSRTYCYTIYNAPLPSPLCRRTSWHVSHPLDVKAMQLAANALIGERDFATFGQPPQGTNTVRQVFRAEWRQETPFFRFEIEATAFLKRMVRSIVGSLQAVGRGKWSIEQFVEALKSAERSAAEATAPPQGLVLEKVKYD